MEHPRRVRFSVHARKEQVLALAYAVKSGNLEITCMSLDGSKSGMSASVSMPLQHRKIFPGVTCMPNILSCDPKFVILTGSPLWECGNPGQGHQKTRMACVC